jgi:hypothetical protein
MVYENIRNARFGLHSEEAVVDGRAQWTVTIWDFTYKRIHQQKICHSWQEYSDLYNQTRVMLEASPGY